ncbi:MAG: hypothetical protein HY786_03905 [Deltaproteobacteria bacterium]|nr:hypothetical protein [Deltaproteobacteria bacterium]
MRTNYKIMTAGFLDAMGNDHYNMIVGISYKERPQTVKIRRIKCLRR